MTHASIQMLMEKLNQLINCTHIPIINNSPAIMSQRRQFQLLYDDLDSIIQTLKHQDIDLHRRLRDAAEEAQYTLDLFLSDVLNRDDVVRSFKSLFLSWFHINPSLNLDHVRRLFKSLEVEFVRRQKILDHSAAAQSCSISRNSLDEIVVGLDRDVELIISSFLERRNKVEVVSIVGMGGIGKTTLATKVFNDPYVRHHFHLRVWITFSQTYDKRAVLIQFLESIGVKQGLEEATDSRLRELVHKKLMGQKYLIVIDDIWNIGSWDNLKLFFPHGNNESRILLTTRLTEVAKHASSGGLIHHLGFLNQERSWELLCEKVFHGNECPEWSIKPGMQIVDNCKGLPLAVVVIAGVLAKEELSEKFWVEIADSTDSYIVGEENGCLKALGLSYNHLPLHLRECFLYLGGFPEDYKFQVKWLICLWLAEGFIQEDGNRSLEDIADSYLMDLIDRNLVIVADKSKSSGAVKACKVHDLVRELCLKKAREERFDLETERLILSTNIITKPYKPVRRFMNTNDPDLRSHPSTGNLRSILCLVGHTSLSVDISKYYHSFVLLRVLDLHKWHLWDFPKGMELLIHLRYLAVWWSSLDFPSSSICNLWNLQTLIFIRMQGYNVLPSNISDLVNLRHLWSNQPFSFPSIEKPMILQTISDVDLKETHSFEKYFPCIKKLACNFRSDERNDFKSLTCLESLRLWRTPVRGKNHITFPATLKRLTLTSCGLAWSDMSIIQSLPNLQVLKLHRSAFKGSCWNTNEQVFPQLKFLRLSWLDIKLWETRITSFPCLKQLEINWCGLLEEIPLEIGDIPTLELI